MQLTYCKEVWVGQESKDSVPTRSDDFHTWHSGVRAPASAAVFVGRSHTSGPQRSHRLDERSARNTSHVRDLPRRLGELSLCNPLQQRETRQGEYCILTIIIGTAGLTSVDSFISDPRITYFSGQPRLSGLCSPGCMCIYPFKPVSIWWLYALLSCQILSIGYQKFAVYYINELLYLDVLLPQIAYYIDMVCYRRNTTRPRENGSENSN